MTSRPSIRNPLLFTVAIFSSLFGLSGIEHGFFEILQGDTETNGFIISAIGPSQRFWLHGTEPAFTLIPNYLISGIAAVIVSSCVIIWSLRFLRNKHSWIPLLLLSIAQFLTGGGFAQIFLSVVLGFSAAGLYRPRRLWKKYIAEKLRSVFSLSWVFSFLAFIMLFLISIAMAVFGLPFGKANPELTYRLMMSSSYMMIILFCLSLLFAYAKDSMMREKA